MLKDEGVAFDKVWGMTETRTWSNEELDARLSAVERITRLFRLERIVYLGVMVVALVMLLTSAAALIWRGAAGPTELSMLFGSSGMITFSCGRVLMMWNRALSFLVPHSELGR